MIVDGIKSILWYWIIKKLITITNIVKNVLKLSIFRLNELLKKLNIEKCVDSLPEANNIGWKIEFPQTIYDKKIIANKVKEREIRKVNFILKFLIKNGIETIKG